MSLGRDRVVVDVSPLEAERPRVVEELACVAEPSELVAVIDEFGCSRTLQVGLVGVSTVLAIAAAHDRRGGGSHTVIAARGRDGSGAETLRRAGLPDGVEVIAARAELALPELLRDGVEIDFALIHGGAPFDQVFIEFTYLDRLLVNGGVIALAGADEAAIRAVLEYVEEARAYERRSLPGAELAILLKLGHQHVDHVPAARAGGLAGADAGNGAQATIDPLAAPGSSASRALFLARARVDELEERVAELGRALVDAEQRAGELVQAHAEMKIIADQLAVSEATRRRLERSLTSITSSPSWRLTAPLRAAKSFLGR